MQNTEFRTGAINPIECVKEGWELIKSDYWLLFGITIVGALIGSATMYVLLGAMSCGIYYAYLEKIDGRSISFETLFKGIDWFAPSLIVILLIIVPTIVIYILIYVFFIAALVVGQGVAGEAGMIGGLFGAGVISLLLVLAMICLHTLMMFAIPLIVDRKLGAVDAMKTSARAVLKNLGGIGGLIAVNFVILFVGQLALCIGAYFALPILMAGNVMAFRKVFPKHGDLTPIFQNRSNFDANL
ncbi:MAG: hypothetical protein WBD22_11430 [Pyrinomonadaceae bacterium]